MNFDFRAARLLLIEQMRTFRDAMTESAPKTAEWFDNIADVSHWLGFLEYLNNNQDGAAAEYKRAADAAGQWAALRPKNPHARGRQSFSLVNAGNALMNARRYTDAEKCYRNAVRLVDGVVSELPLNAYYRARSVEAHGQLANVLRIENQSAAWEHAARQQLDRAKALVRACGSAPEHMRYVAAASLELAKAQARLSKWNDADRSYATAVAVRDELRTAHPNATQFSFDYASALISHAGFLNFRGQTDRAAEMFSEAIDIMEKGQSAATAVNDRNQVSGVFEEPEHDDHAHPAPPPTPATKSR
jgi:tetratricopeptide (TPR) repeat protein